MIRWMMGGLDVVDYQPAVSILPPLAAGFLVMAALSRELNLLSTGEELALARGVNVERTKLFGYISASLVTGAVVSMTGPISFVGLIIPHAMRMALGPDHRLLVPAALLSGASFLMLCDTLARVILPGAEMPVGIITACLGGPFFIWILRTRGKRLVF